MYHERQHEPPSAVDGQPPTQQHTGIGTSHHHPTPTHLPPHVPPPQHTYYDPSQYQYLPPSQHLPMVDHHLQNTYQVHHAPRVERPTFVDPMWPSITTNDVYLHVDPGTLDYPLHTTTGTTTTTTAAPLDEMMMYPVQPFPKESSQKPTQRSPQKNKKGKVERKVRSRDSGDATYVLRIHEMLENAEKERQTHIVSWQPHGRAFRIHNEALFVQQVMPRYFKAKIGSFQRWLRAWGFIRMTEGKDRGAWYHRYFVRGVTSFCKDMTRQQMAHAMVNWPPAGQVPDFYSAASGSTLSEQPPTEHYQQQQQPSTDVTEMTPHQPLKTQNPKRLRGTILEDLRQMLNDAEMEGHTHIVGWMPHGRAFKIHNKELFEGLMPRYFKTAKVTHLNDTLRIWGFRRFKEMGRDKGCFYHKFFVRGDPSLTRHLTRIQMKESMDHWPPPEGEPDLYLLGPTSASASSKLNDPSSSTTNSVYAISQHTTTNRTEDGTNLQGNEENAETAIHSTNDDPSFTTTTVLTQDCGPSRLGLVSQSDATANNRGDGTYVLRLHEMLEDAEKEGHQHIVSWQPHGRAFRVHREKEFVEKIMPRYFKAKMGSFLRWCRAWGFVRMTEGRDRGAWYHRYFVRGVTSLSRSLSRQQMLKAMEDWLPPGHVPNFYTSGIGEVLSEATHRPIETPPNVTCKNPKQLRGTVPEDLRRMLEDAEQEGNTTIVSWLPHGRAFKVHDKAAFAAYILPRYFKASKFTYFSDALRMWGWHRLKEGHDKGAYYHRLFIKDQPQLTRHLHRIQMKKSMTPWPPQTGEPNLYLTPVEQMDAFRGTEEARENVLVGPHILLPEMQGGDVVVLETATIPCVVDGSDASEMKEHVLWQEATV